MHKSLLQMKKKIQKKPQRSFSIPNWMCWNFHTTLYKKKKSYIDFKRMYFFTTKLFVSLTLMFKILFWFSCYYNLQRYLDCMSCDPNICELLTFCAGCELPRGFVPRIWFVLNIWLGSYWMNICDGCRDELLKLWPNCNELGPMLPILPRFPRFFCNWPVKQIYTIIFQNVLYWSMWFRWVCRVFLSFCKIWYF